MTHTTLNRAEAAKNWKKFHELFSTSFIHEAVGATAELEVADVLGEEPMTTETLGKKAGIDPSCLYRLLRSLAAYEIFEELADGRFQHNSFSRQLRKDHPFSIRPMVLLWGLPKLRDAWKAFPAAMRDGKSAFFHAHGAPVYESLAKDPKSAEIFHQAMVSNSEVSSQEIAESFPFSDYQNVVDLGGGVGALLAAVLKAHPKLTGAVFDMAPISERAESYLRSKGLSDRAQFLSGNFLDSVPDHFDLYMIKNTLWNLTDPHCLKVLKNIRRAIGKSGRLLIIEYLVQAQEEPWSTTFDLQMLNVTGGRARTREEYAALLNESGFKVAAIFKASGETEIECRPI